MAAKEGAAGILPPRYTMKKHSIIDRAAPPPLAPSFPILPSARDRAVRIGVKPPAHVAAGLAAGSARLCGADCTFPEPHRAFDPTNKITGEE